MIWDGWFSVVEHGFSVERLATLRLRDRQDIAVAGGDERSHVVIGRLP